MYTSIQICLRDGGVYAVFGLFSETLYRKSYSDVSLWYWRQSWYFSSSSLLDIEGIINHDLCLLSAWARLWLVTFNPNKTDAMLFALRLEENFPSLILENTPIKFVEHHKHLGLTFGNVGKWHKHVDKILKSASKIIGLMRKLQFELNGNALNHTHTHTHLYIYIYIYRTYDQ